MEYRLHEKEAFKVTGKMIEVNMKNHENATIIPELWNSCMSDPEFKSDLFACVGPLGVIGVVIDLKKNDSIQYMIAVESENQFNQKYQTIEIPASTWAIFEANGPIPDSIITTFNKIHQSWLPYSEYQHKNTPSLEIYFQSDTPGICKSEIWIPVEKKS